MHELREMLHYQHQGKLASISSLPPHPLPPMVPSPGYYPVGGGMAIRVPPRPKRFFSPPVPVLGYPRPPLPLEPVPVAEFKRRIEIIDPHCPGKRDDLMISYCFLSKGQDGVSCVLKSVRSEISLDAWGKQHLLIDPISEVTPFTPIHFDGDIPPFNQIVRLQCDEKGNNLRLFELEHNHEYKPLLNAPLFINGLLVTPSDKTSSALSMNG